MFWLLLPFEIIHLLLRTQRTSRPILARNFHINQYLVHFARTLSIRIVSFPYYSAYRSVTDKFRVVHDLSFPESNSVNDGISTDHYLKQFFKLRLPGINRLVEFINIKGRGCHVFKKDPRRAYRQIPIDPKDYPLLGTYIDGSLYFHTALPFGLRSATMICQRTIKSVVYILNSEGISVDVYIDDFYGTECMDSSEQVFQRLNSLFNELGIMAATEKDSPPCHEMLCLGIWVNTLDTTLSVPAFRISELHKELHAW